MGVPVEFRSFTDRGVCEFYREFANFLRLKYLRSEVVCLESYSFAPLQSSR
jgi:hypothetical protein